MTEKLNNVYVCDTALVAGPLEKRGKVSEYFDKTYDDYNIDKSFELSEVKMNKDVLDILFSKTGCDIDNIDLVVGGDLLNQLCATSYAIKDLNRPCLGVFSACATSMESVIVASKFINSKKSSKAICITSSHNLASEKQFRNPTEYGYTKPKTATFTSTGAAAIMLTNEKTSVKVTDYTIGTIQDLGQKDPNNMGAVMAPGAADTLYRHLTDLKRRPDYYDLILTGDLGLYGKEILIKYMKKVYDIDISNNYNDCGTMLYDLKKQPVFAGGSGPVCSALVVFSYIIKLMKEKKLKRVLILPTGALFSPTMFFQKDSLPCISHAVSLEVDSK